MELFTRSILLHGRGIKRKNGQADGENGRSVVSCAAADSNDTERAETYGGLRAMPYGTRRPARRIICSEESTTRTNDSGGMSAPPLPTPPHLTSRRQVTSTGGKAALPLFKIKVNMGVT